jgi:hypothetical protein
MSLSPHSSRIYNNPTFGTILIKTLFWDNVAADLFVEKPQ